ncbi:hypothetical protein SFR_1716 [Streptomyces sp. FR-008]|nr:hypothetical protein SFR_1716 [Streptomyces sp. FR-008]
MARMTGHAHLSRRLHVDLAYACSALCPAASVRP